MEDVKLLITGPQTINLRWRLGDEAIDTLERMGGPSLSPNRSRGLADSGFEDYDDHLREFIRFSVERRDSYCSDWRVVADGVPGGLNGKVTLHNCPREMYGTEYRVTAWIDGMACAPSKTVRVPAKICESLNYTVYLFN